MEEKPHFGMKPAEIKARADLRPLDEILDFEKESKEKIKARKEELWNEM